MFLLLIFLIFLQNVLCSDSILNPLHHLHTKLKLDISPSPHPFLSNSELQLKQSSSVPLLLNDILKSFFHVRCTTSEQHVWNQTSSIYFKLDVGVIDYIRKDLRAQEHGIIRKRGVHRGVRVPTTIVDLSSIMYKPHEGQFCFKASTNLHEEEEKSYKQLGCINLVYATYENEMIQKLKTILNYGANILYFPTNWQLLIDQNRIIRLLDPSSQNIYTILNPRLLFSAIVKYHGGIRFRKDTWNYVNVDWKEQQLQSSSLMKPFLPRLLSSKSKQKQQEGISHIGFRQSLHDPPKPRLWLAFKGYTDETLTSLMAETVCCKKCSELTRTYDAVESAIDLINGDGITLDYRPRQGVLTWLMKPFSVFQSCEQYVLPDQLLKDLGHFSSSTQLIVQSSSQLDIINSLVYLKEKSSINTVFLNYIIFSSDSNLNEALIHFQSVFGTDNKITWTSIKPLPRSLHRNQRIMINQKLSILYQGHDDPCAIKLQSVVVQKDPIVLCVPRFSKSPNIVAELKSL